MQEIREDLTLFNTGLAALVNTFSIVLEDSDEGRQALDAVNSALTIINNLLEVNDMTTPPAPAPAPVPAVKPAYITELEGLTYSVTEAFNGDAMHIIEAHLRTTPDVLTLDQLVMTLNMCRVVRNGKESRLTVAQRADIASMHPAFTASKNTKKAQREALSEIEKRLEDEHGKYASKATLTKVKFDTAVSYGDDWLERVTGFADAIFEAGEYTVTLTDEPLCAPAVEYLPDDVPAHYDETATQGGEVEAYIDTHTGERLGVDARGRVWRTPAPAPRKVSALDLFMKR